MNSKLCKLGCLLISICTLGLFGANTEVYDSGYGIQIVKSSVELYLPGDGCLYEPLSRVEYRGMYCVRYRIDLANGMYVTDTKYYDEDSYDDRLLEREYSGYVNVIIPLEENPKKNFSIIFQNGEQLQDVKVWANFSPDVQGVLTAKSCTKRIKEIAGWFSTERKMQFILCFDNETIWTTTFEKDSDSQIDFTGLEFCRLGNSRHPLLVCRFLLQKEFPLVSISNCLDATPLR